MGKHRINPERRAEIGRERKAQTRRKILTAAFDTIGRENGLFVRVDDIAKAAGVTRTTFYNHFSSMEDLRDALSFEATHDFLAAVTHTIASYSDARERSAFAIRFYLKRARAERSWGWSMLNLSAQGLIFGRETYRQAELTVREGIEEGVFIVPSSKVGRDLLLGSTLAAMGSITREETAPDYPEIVAGYILFALGVPYETAKDLAQQKMPQLIYPRGGEKDLIS